MSKLVVSSILLVLPLASSYCLEEVVLPDVEDVDAGVIVAGPQVGVTFQGLAQGGSIRLLVLGQDQLVVSTAPGDTPQVIGQKLRQVWEEAPADLNIDYNLRAKGAGIMIQGVDDGNVGLVIDDPGLQTTPNVVDLAVVAATAESVRLGWSLPPGIIFDTIYISIDNGRGYQLDGDETEVIFDVATVIIEDSIPLDEKSVRSLTFSFTTVLHGVPSDFLEIEVPIPEE